MGSFNIFKLSTLWVPRLIPATSRIEWKFFETLRIEPGAAVWEVQSLPLSYGATRPIFITNKFSCCAPIGKHIDNAKKYRPISILGSIACSWKVVGEVYFLTCTVKLLGLRREVSRSLFILGWPGKTDIQNNWEQGYCRHKGRQIGLLNPLLATKWIHFVDPLPVLTSN